MGQDAEFDSFVSAMVIVLVLAIILVVLTGCKTPHYPMIL